MNFDSTVIAFDFGIQSIGVAVGQRITKTANPLKTLRAQNGTPNWKLVSFLLNDWKVEEIVIGLPLNMDGTEQVFTARVRKFSYKIRDFFGIEAKLHDERMSTIEARSRLFEHSGFRGLSKYRVHSVSAAIILESYLDQDYKL